MPGPFNGNTQIQLAASAVINSLGQVTSERGRRKDVMG
jgi:hypothetical protein